MYCLAQISTSALIITNVVMVQHALMVSTNLHVNVFRDLQHNFVKSVSKVSFSVFVCLFVCFFFALLWFLFFQKCLEGNCCSSINPGYLDFPIYKLGLGDYTILYTWLRCSFFLLF